MKKKWKILCIGSETIVYRFFVRKYFTWHHKSRQRWERERERGKEWNKSKQTLKQSHLFTMILRATFCDSFDSFETNKKCNSSIRFLQLIWALNNNKTITTILSFIIQVLERLYLPPLGCVSLTFSRLFCFKFNPVSATNHLNVFIVRICRTSRQASL